MLTPLRAARTENMAKYQVMAHLFLSKWGIESTSRPRRFRSDPKRLVRFSSQFADDALKKVLVIAAPVFPTLRPRHLMRLAVVLLR